MFSLNQKLQRGDYFDAKQRLEDSIKTAERRCQAILDQAESMGSELTSEQAAEFDELLEEIKQDQAELADLHGHRDAQLAALDRAQCRVRLDDTKPRIPRAGKEPNMTQNIQHRVSPLRSFKGPEAARDAYDCGMWLRSFVARLNHNVDEAAEAQIAKRGWTVKATATEGSPSGGGYLVPTPLSNAIIDVRALAGVSRRLARIIPMTSETLAVPKKTAGTTVYYPGEAGSITASDQTWGQINLTAKKRAILSKISQELVDDAVIGVIDDLASQMGTDFAVKEDSEFINGDGTSTYGGVSGLLDQLGSAGVYDAGGSTSSGVDTWPELTMADFTNTMALVPDKFMQYELSWLCSSAFYYGVMLDRLADGGGNSISDLRSGAVTPMFLGHRVLLSNQMPTATAVSTVSCLFGAFSQAAMIGERTGIRIAQSEHLNFAEDLLALRATTRYDINCHECGDSNNAGAIVGLKTSAT